MKSCSLLNQIEDPRRKRCKRRPKRRQHRLSASSRQLFVALSQLLVGVFVVKSFRLCWKRFCFPFEGFTHVFHLRFFRRRRLQSSKPWRRRAPPPQRRRGVGGPVGVKPRAFRVHFWVPLFRNLFYLHFVGEWLKYFDSLRLSKNDQDDKTHLVEIGFESIWAFPSPVPVLDRFKNALPISCVWKD